MSTPLDDFETDLVATAPAVSFDFSTFAPFLINALIDLLSGCGQDGTARAKVALKNPTSRKTKYLVRRAVKSASDESGIAVRGSELTLTGDHLLQHCSTCSDEELDELFGETRDITDTITFL
jgi:hypothetical protein